MRKFFLYLFIIINLSSTHGQSLDSLVYEINALSVIPFNGTVAHYLHANKYGLVEDTLFNQILGIGISHPFNANKTFSFAFHASIFARYSLEKTNILIQQGFIGVKYKAITLHIGRRQQTWGVHNPELSMGSMAISRNIRPLPMIRLAIDSFVNVPFTKGFVKFKGDFGHAWLEKNRYVENPFVHIKSMYLKSNVNLPVNMYVGLTHFAMWGGQHPNGDSIPQGFDDYLRVIIGKSSSNRNLRNEYLNVLGNHLGIVEYGLTASMKFFDFRIYNQMPYEDKTGLKRFFFSKDRLLGLDIKLTRTRRPFQFLYEYLHTLYQSGPGLPDPPEGYSRKDLSPNYGYHYGGRDDYYNNSLYRTGWTYLGRIIGNPLFMTERYASKHLRHVNSFYQQIVNNRIRGHHLGMTTTYAGVKFRLLGTYSENYGAYAGLNGGQRGWLTQMPEFEDYQYAFKQPLRQWYGVLEVSTFLNVQKNLNAGISMALDKGEIYSASGIGISLTWSYRSNFKPE